MAYITPNTVTGSDVLTAALWNTQIRDNFEAVVGEVRNPNSCRVRRNVGSTVGFSASGGLTPVQWNQPDVYDFGSMHDPAVNPQRITFPVAGIYAASTFFSVTGTGFGDAAVWAIFARFNSAGVRQDGFGSDYREIRRRDPQDGASMISVNTMLHLTGFTYANAGDYMMVEITSIGSNSSGTAFGNVPNVGATMPNGYTLSVHQVGKNI
jgi:hypothetical protein